MSAVPFDTRAFVKRLQGAGFTVEQAEVLTDLFKESGMAMLEQLKRELQNRTNMEGKEL